MGDSLFKAYPDFVEKADTILGYSIVDLCLNNPDERLTQTQFTQPALYVVNALMYYKTVGESDTPPDFVAGHSLGEYNALLAAGGFDFETGLHLVKKRGMLMSQASGGKMAAIIGLDAEKIAIVLKENALESIDIANYNSLEQIVIAGPTTDIENAQSTFEAAGAKRFMPLNVSAPFHSRYMQPAQETFETFIESFTFSELTIPVISNSHARPYESSAIKKNLCEQIAHSVRWTESVQYLLDQGDMDFEEIGPGKVLSGLVKRIKKEMAS